MVKICICIKPIKGFEVGTHYEYWPDFEEDLMNLRTISSNVYSCFGYKKFNEHFEDLKKFRNKRMKEILK